jgi:hypothetical protein
MVNSVSSQLCEELEKRGFRVVQVPVTEFLRAGGAAKCRGTRVVFAYLCIASGLLMLIGLLYPRVMIFANSLFGIFVLANALGLLGGYWWSASPRGGAVAPQQ